MTDNTEDPDLSTLVKAQLETELSSLSHRTTLYVYLVAILSVVLMLAVLLVFLVRPDADNSTLITTLIGILGPTIAAFLAAALQQVHLSMNKRLTQLLDITRQAERVKTKLEIQEKSTSQ